MVKDGIKADDLIKKPAGRNVGHGIPISDDFKGIEPGFQWIIPTADLDKVSLGDGKLELEARWSGPKDGLVFGVRHVNPSFEVSVEMEIEEGTSGGILLGGHGIGLHRGEPGLHAVESFDRDAADYWPLLYSDGNMVMHRAPELQGHGYDDPVIHLKIINHRNDLSYWYSKDGREWIKMTRSGFSSRLEPQLFASGSGRVIFRNFRYKGIE